MKLAIESLQGALDEPIALFVATASFEDRCRTILEGLSGAYERALLFSQYKAHGGDMEIIKSLYNDNKKDEGGK